MRPVGLPGTDLVLRDPAWLVASALVALALLWARRRRRATLALAPSPLLAPAGIPTPSGAAAPDPAPPRTWRVALLGLPRGLQVVGLLLLAFAAARPARYVPVDRPVEGIDLLLCVDTSSSMRQDDMEDGRTRLEVARDAAARFVAARPDDRIGLLTFARWPDLRCPPTLDHAALSRLLAAVQPLATDDEEDATGIGTALARAAQVLRGAASASRVVVLLTDGEENVATTGGEGEIAPLHAAQLCAEVGVRVHAVVAGRGRRDASGAFAPLDLREAERVARRTGGLLLEARDARALDEVYRRIDALERTPFREERVATQDGFLPFLWSAVALLLLARLLETTLLGTLP